MTKRVLTCVFVLLMMVSSGCTGAVEEVVNEIEDIESPIIDEIIDEVLAPITNWMDVGERERTSPELISYNSCDLLEEDIRENLKEKMRINILQQSSDYYGGGMWIEDDMVFEDGMAEGAPVAADSADSGASSNSNTREEGVDFSGTNNQEDGVDESDFVKTDGEYIYMINDGQLVILGVPEFGEINFQSSTIIDGNAREMMLSGNKLVILSSVYSWNIPEGDQLRDLLWDENVNRMRISSLTKFSVIDITEKDTPEIINELYLEGQYLTAREQNGMVRTITHGYLDLPGLLNWVNIPKDLQDEYYSSGFDWDEPRRQEIWNASMNYTIQNNNDIINSSNLEDLMPQMYHDTGSTIIKVPMHSEMCNEFVASEDNAGIEFTSILTLDLLSQGFSFEADHLMGNWPTIYASGDTLLIAEPAQDWWWYWGVEDIKEETNIHAFSLDEEGTSYIGSGRVNGTVLNQFSLSEYDGKIRLATTTGQWNRWWVSNPEPMENHVIVLQPNETTSTLDEIGRIDGIAPDERIWSARFTEDRAYLVTFRQIDPLWTIDLSDPFSPTIIGELEVPGVSTYIHPLDENNILTIGIGPADLETGLGLDWSSTQVSLFDVSNFSNPELASVLPLSPVSEDNRNDWTWGWSEATYEHKAFQYWAPKDMLAVPLSTYRSIYVEADLEEKLVWCEDRINYMTWLLNEDEMEEVTVEEERNEEDDAPRDDSTSSSDDAPREERNDEEELTEEDREYLMNYCMENDYYDGYWEYEYISQLILVNVQPGSPLTVYGTIDHNQFYNNQDCNYCFWGSGETTIRRSIFMGDYIYAISSGGVTVTNLTSMETVEEIEFREHLSENNNQVEISVDEIE